MAFSLCPDDPMWRAVCEAPQDDLPKLIFADYVEEYGLSDWAEVIRGMINGESVKQNHSFNISMFGQGWLKNFPADMFPFLVWRKGFPTFIDLSYNRRQALIFQGNDYYGEQRGNRGASTSVNRVHAHRYLQTLPSLLPVTEILLNPFHIYLQAQMITCYVKDEDATHIFPYWQITSPHALLDWFYALGREMSMPHGRYRQYENLLRGHGDMRLAFNARTVTVRGRPGRRAYSGHLVNPIQGYAEFDQGDNGFTIRGVQQRLRPVSDQQAIQHMDTFRGRGYPTTLPG